MAMAEVKVKGWGNSLGIVIPKNLADLEDVKIGDTIKVEILKSKKNGFGIWKGKCYEPFVRDHDDHDEF